VRVVRYNPDGSLDPAFDGNGKVVTPIGAYAAANDVAIQPDARIVAAGFQSDGSRQVIALVRYNSDGSRDASFDSDGIVTTQVDFVECSLVAPAVVELGCAW